MATIAEFLLIKIGFDNDKLKKDADKAKKNIDSVDERVEKFKNNLKKFTKSGLTEFFVALAGTSGFAAFIANITAADAALGRLSKTTGMSVEAISAWSDAAERAGGSAAEMQSGIANMSKELTNFKYTGESTLVPFLAQMGVSIVDVNGKLKDQNQIMLDLADRAQNMPKEDFANLAMANGFNQSQVNLMLQGRKALQQQINEQNRNAIVTKQQAEQAQKLETAWIDVKQSFMGVARTVAYVLVPPLTVLLKGIAAIFTFIGNHKVVMVGLFALLIPKIIATTKLFLMLTRSISMLTPIIKIATLAMRGFGLSSALALAPIILIGTALALLLDDFLTFQAGGDSLIPWDKVFGGAKTAIQDVKDLIFSVGTLMDLLKAVGQGDWTAAAALGKKLMMDATPVGMAAKVADRVVNDGKTVEAVNNDAKEASEKVNQPPPPVQPPKPKVEQPPTPPKKQPQEKNVDVPTTSSTGQIAQSTQQMANSSKVIQEAVKDLGVTEKSNRSTIMGYQKDIGYMSKTLDAWCASFVGSKLQKAGFKSTHSASAASYLKYGQAADMTKPLQSGMVGLVKRKGGSGYHVFLIEKDNGDGTVSTIEGNYSNKVSRNIRKKSSLAAVRTPVQDGKTTSTTTSTPVNNNTVPASNVLFGTSPVAKGLKNYHKYDDLILEMSNKYGIDPALLKGMMHTESHFNPNARSPVGAGGLIQMMPATAKRFGVNNVFDPRQNVEGAAKYVAYLKKRFKGDMTKVIAAYNAGEGNVDKYGGIPPFRETRDYVQRVRENAAAATFAGGNSVGASTKTQAALKGSGLTASNVHSETHIGNININTQATDAAGIAKTIPAELKNKFAGMAYAASSGMA